MRVSFVPAQSVATHLLVRVFELEWLLAQAPVELLGEFCVLWADGLADLSRNEAQFNRDDARRVPRTPFFIVKPSSQTHSSLAGEWLPVLGCRLFGWLLTGQSSSQF